GSQVIKNGTSSCWALAILAHYAVILHWLRGHIWLDGWGEEIVDAVRQVLSSGWHACIAWVLKEVADSHTEVP
ncbi:hypothetical protein V1509DRAFT_648909, partial [Lipomyces kononenkoae]